MVRGNKREVYFHQKAVRRFAGSTGSPLAPGKSPLEFGLLPLEFIGPPGLQQSPSDPSPSFCTRHDTFVDNWHVRGRVIGWGELGAMTRVPESGAFIYMATVILVSLGKTNLGWAQVSFLASSPRCA